MRPVIKRLVDKRVTTRSTPASRADCHFTSVWVTASAVIGHACTEESICRQISLAPQTNHRRLNHVSGNCTVIFPALCASVWVYVLLKRLLFRGKCQFVLWKDRYAVLKKRIHNPKVGGRYPARGGQKVVNSFFENL